MTAATPELWQRCTAEECLLLACLRQDWRAPWTLRAAALAAGDLDWPRVFAIAVRHQVAPLVFDNLARTDGVVARMPSEIVARFHHETLQNMAAKQALAAELAEVVAWLAARGARVMLIKGTALDRRIWHARPWLTVSGDLDLMIAGPVADLDAEVRRRTWELNHATPTVDVQGTPHPDLSMGGVLRLDFDAIWHRARPLDVGGSTAFGMDAEDELLATCIQACRKRYFRLKSLAELGELLAREPIDWQVFASRARDAGCHWIAFTALFAAHLTVGAPVPDELARRLRVPPIRAALLRWLVRRRSFCTFDTTFDHVAVGGRRLGRSLLLPYASHTWSQLLRSGRALRRPPGGVVQP